MIELTAIVSFNDKGDGAGFWQGDLFHGDDPDVSTEFFTLKRDETRAQALLMAREKWPSATILVEEKCVECDGRGEYDDGDGPEPCTECDGGGVCHVEWSGVIEGAMAMPAPHIRKTPVEHELKTWPDFFQAVWIGDKRFECRKDDREYQPGDTLLLREWSQSGGYTGRAVRVDVPYLLGGQWPGLAPGYVVMSIIMREQFARYGK